MIVGHEKLHAAAARQVDDAPILGDEGPADPIESRTSPLRADDRGPAGLVDDIARAAPVGAQEDARDLAVRGNHPFPDHQRPAAPLARSVRHGAAVCANDRLRHAVERAGLATVRDDEHPMIRAFRGIGEMTSARMENEIPDPLETRPLMPIHDRKPLGAVGGGKRADAAVGAYDGNPDGSVSGALLLSRDAILLRPQTCRVGYNSAVVAHRRRPRHEIERLARTAVDHDDVIAVDPCGERDASALAGHHGPADSGEWSDAAAVDGEIGVRAAALDVRGAPASRAYAEPPLVDALGNLRDESFSADATRMWRARCNGKKKGRRE